MPTIIPATASNPDGCIAVAFIVIALVFFALRRRCPAEEMRETYRRHGRWN